MLQFQANRDMLRHYARLARKARFRGLFCQISDPVDHLCRAVFLESNRDCCGRLDYQGLLPEQIQGFGLGVMGRQSPLLRPEAGNSPGLHPGLRSPRSRSCGRQRPRRGL